MLQVVLPGARPIGCCAKVLKGHCVGWMLRLLSAKFASCYAYRAFCLQDDSITGSAERVLWVSFIEFLDVLVLGVLGVTLTRSPR